LELKLQHRRDPVGTTIRDPIETSLVQQSLVAKLGNGLKLQRNFSGLGEMCQPAVSKHYRMEVLELKLQDF
jgi:hypothetical protein